MAPPGYAYEPTQNPQPSILDDTERESLQTFQATWKPV